MAKIKITRAEYISRLRQKSSWDAAFIRNIPLSGKGEDAFKKPYSNSHLAFICISTTARAIAQVPVQVQTWKKDKWVPLPNHPFQLLMDKPNSMQSVYLFKESLISHLLIDGNVWFLPIPPGVDVPTAMYPIQQKHMEKIIDKDTGQLIGWNYTPQPNKDKIMVFADEVGHIRFFNPDDPILGLAPHTSGKFPLMADYKAAAYNDKFFDNGGVTSGAFYTDKLLQKEQYERMKEQLDQRHTGYDKAHRFAVLEGGLKYQEIGIGHRDMDFLGLRKFSRDEILQIYGMKKAIISITEDLNYATASEQKKEWWNSTLIPLMNLITSEFNRVLLHSTGLQNMRLAFDLIAVDALQDQFKDKVEMASRLYAMGCTFEQINERLVLGFETRPWQKFGYMSLATVPVGDDGLPLVDSSGESPPKKEVAPIEEPKQVLMITGKTDKEIKSELKDKKYGPRWKAFIRRLSPLERQMEGKVSKVFFQMRKKVLEMTNDGKAVSGMIQKKVSPEEFAQRLRAEDFPQEKDLLQKYSAPIYATAVSEGADSFIQEMGLEMSFDLHDPAAVEFLGIKPIKIRKVTDTIKRNCLDQLQTGMGNGESIDQLAERIREVFNAGSSRARMIARTEVIGASNFGRHAAMRESGFQMKEWYTAQDERVRGTHVDMGNHEPILINESWKFDDGEVEYPGDWNGPAAEVINCRCIEIVSQESSEE
jgi:HK97 family phage portal protein